MGPPGLRLSTHHIFWADAGPGAFASDVCAPGAYRIHMPLPPGDKGTVPPPLSRTATHGYLNSSATPATFSSPASIPSRQEALLAALQTIRGPQRQTKEVKEGPWPVSSPNHKSEMRLPNEKLAGAGEARTTRPLAGPLWFSS